MTAEMIFVFALLLTVVVVFVLDKFRMDFVAMMVLTVLAASGIITPQEAVSGFGSTVVMMIAGLFIVGEALMLTGVANATGGLLLKVGGKNEQQLLLVLLPLVAFLSAFMSSTGAVAILIPVVMSMAKKSAMQPQQLLMPLAFCALIGGMLTLIGTPPNIVAHEQMQAAGYEGFRFFAFTPIGLVIFAVGAVYLIFIGRFLLPKNPRQNETKTQNTLIDFMRRYGVTTQLHKLTVEKNSALIGATVSAFRPRRDYEVTPFAIERSGRRLSTFLPILLNTTIKAGDELWVYATLDNVRRFSQDFSTRAIDITVRTGVRLNQRFGFVEVLIPPESKYEGKTLFEAAFREDYGLNIIGVRRRRHLVDMQFNHTQLEDGDTLLLAGSWQHIRTLNDPRNLLVLDTPAELEEAPVHAGKAIMAVTIVLAMLVTMTMGWLPNLTVILLAAMAMIVTRCLTLKEAYRSLNTTSLVLIAGMLPMAKAMENSGALTYLVEHLVYYFQDLGPLWLCAGLFILTSILSQFISNTATTVLLVPIALSTALALNYQPEALVMTVAIAASTAFATPIASPVNMLVLNPGNYRFADFAKVGIPLQILALMITLVLVPILFPF